MLIKLLHFVNNLLLLLPLCCAGLDSEAFTSKCRIMYMIQVTPLMLQLPLCMTTTKGLLCLQCSRLIYDFALLHFALLPVEVCLCGLINLSLFLWLRKQSRTFKSEQSVEICLWKRLRVSLNDVVLWVCEKAARVMCLCWYENVSL